MFIVLNLLLCKVDLLTVHTIIVKVMRVNTYVAKKYLATENNVQM